MEVSSASRLVTRRVTVSPCRHRKVGAGIEPLMVVARRGAPVKLTGVSAIVRSNSVPLSTGALPVTVSAARTHSGLSQGDIPIRTPPAASPRRNRRRGKFGMVRK